jgi:anti-sigma factor (TIGR02949 family)
MGTDECRNLFALLSEYLDDELPPDTCEHIRAHIAGCPPCVEFVNSLQRSVELLHGHRSGEAPGPLPQAVREDLRMAYRRMLAARGARPV